MQREFFSFSIFACLRVLKWATLTNPKQQAAIPLFGHTQIPYMLVSMGSTALAAAVVLPRYGGLN